MRSVIFTLLLLLQVSVYAQRPEFNKGGASTKKYFVVLSLNMEKGLPVLEVIINGKPRRFLLDTGALTALSDELAKELGLNEEASIDVGDSGGKTDKMKVVTVPQIPLGGVTFEQIPAVVLEPSFFTSCLGIDGIIGSNLLRNSIVYFSAKAGTVTLTDQLKKLNVENVEPAPMELSTSQSNPYIRVNFSNGSKTGNELLLFDSGMKGFYDLSVDAYVKTFKPLGLFIEQFISSGVSSMGIHGADKDEKKYKVVIPTLTIDNFKFSRVSATTNNTNSSRIGAGLLQFGDVAVDYKHKKFYFIPNRDTSSLSGIQKSWPVEFIPENDKLTIGLVWDPALANTINRGDEVIRFGEIKLENIDLCKMMSSLKFTEDTAMIVLRDVATKKIKEIMLHRN